MNAGRTFAFSSSLVVAIALAVAGSAAQTNMAPVRYVANAINMDPTVRLTATTVDIAVTHWSSDADRDRLVGLLAEKGQGKLLTVLQDLPKVGTIKTPDSLAYDLRYARRIPGEDGGERVVLLTDRDIAFWEARNQTRSLEYPFMVIELRLNANGEGEGKLTVATKLSSDQMGKQIVLENYGSQPVRLTEVRRQGGSQR